MENGIRRTPLYGEHLKSQAKIVEFAGYHMPVYYPTGIVAEHNAVRNAAGLFDVSHMGVFDISGPGALDLIQYVTTNDAARIAEWHAQYTLLCQEDGCALDDCIVYRLPDRYMLVVNAGTRERDLEWILKFSPAYGATVVDRTDEGALLAVQGPRAEQILSGLVDVDLSGIRYFRCTAANVAGHRAIVSRTGYTGEDGFELYISAESAVPVWRALLDAGDEVGLVAVGLGARDSLRLEMGYILYGNDLDDQHTPLEAGLGWAVDLDKGDFIGRAALVRQQEDGPRQRLVGFSLADRGFPRHGYEVRAGGEPIGTVTSGIISPTLGKGIGLAYVPTEFARPDTAIDIVIRDRPHAAHIVSTPFYRGGSIRR
ncbi:MAG TPA: glycine cleavage system aminomethyltransferase GcvT [Longimicrobiales bacterium]|nr:glycine cleavage system aminomethyltransferase GcvT [Longimicrobiales bacterium]